MLSTVKKNYDFDNVSRRETNIQNILIKIPSNTCSMFSFLKGYLGYEKNPRFLETAWCWNPSKWHFNSTTTWFYLIANFGLFWSTSLYLVLVCVFPLNSSTKKKKKKLLFIIGGGDKSHFPIQTLITNDHINISQSHAMIVPLYDISGAFYSFKIICNMFSCLGGTNIDFYDKISKT